MRYSGAALMALTLLALPAQGEVVTAGDPATIVKALQDYGVAATLETDTGGLPLIRVKISGANSFVDFFGCNDAGADCVSITFSAGFAVDPPYSAEQANVWNSKNRFASSYVNDAGEARIAMDVNLAPDGMSAEAFANMIDWWDYSLGEFKTFINW